jgi:integrase
MAKRLTDVGVVKAKRPGIMWDAAATGLGLKILSSGKKVWFQQLKWPGCRVQSKRNLGYYPGLSLAEAREKAERFYDLNKSGVDPFAAEEEAKEEERRRKDAERRAEALKDASTFGAFAERYIAERSANRRSQADAREIRRTLIAAWGDRPIHTITPRDVRELIAKIKTRGPWEARNCWTHVVQLFKSAVFDELIEVSPAASLDRRMVFKNVKLAPRARVLADAELRALWRASEGLEYPYGPFYQLLLLTGCRVSEVAGARWREFVLGDRLWTIPPARFKSEQVHLVPLTDETMSVVEALPRCADGDYLFSTRGGAKPVNSFSKAKARLDSAMADELETNVVPFVNHDIRRTFRTRLSELRVPDHVAELCIGHARTGLAGTYDRHKYIDERREAFGLWAARLKSIVEPASAPPPEPSKVVAFHARRRGAI